jgi:hypothetical protein
VPAGVLQREDGVAADVTGAAGNEDWNLAHARGLAKRDEEGQPAGLISALYALPD